METEISKRQQLFDTMIVSPIAQIKADKKTSLMLSNKDRYVSCAKMFINLGLKWWFIAVIHEMECSQNFRKYLGNGQSLNKVTTIVPKGRGPFKTFEDGVMDALTLQGADKIQDWSLGNVLYFLEGYNGYGYEKYHNINSPYLWAGSNQYEKGKYVSDGHFVPDAVSQQIGVAILLQSLFQKDTQN